MKIKICSDSTCDLSAEILEKNDISILPLYVMKEDEEHRDGKEIVFAEEIDPAGIRVLRRRRKEVN